LASGCSSVEMASADPDWTGSSGHSDCDWGNESGSESDETGIKGDSIVRGFFSCRAWLR
jgi:hypothetical protein